MTSGKNTDPSATGRSSLSMSTLIRSFSESSEADKPFEPFVGGPRLFILMLYATVLVAASLEFFAGQELWPGNWEVYNTYVFVASGVFVFLGMVMLLTQVHDASMDYSLPIPRAVLGGIGFVSMALSAIVLTVWGKEMGTWAIPLSILLLYGFLLMLLGSRAFSMRESAKLFVFGTGLVIMVMFPVHEAFDVARSSPDDYPFTLLNLLLLIPGMSLALISVQSLQTRDGYVGAWLLGAMVIFLLAFHEQVGILRTGNYSPYDRALAMIGITFSFLPLVMYAWRERFYFFLMRRLRNANEMIERGEHDNAIAQTEAAIRQCAKVGIDDRFALPWSLKGDALYRKKDYRKAAVAYETALKIDPKDSASWCNLGNTHAFEGRNEEALKAFEEALKADPNNGYAWNNKGTIYQRLEMDEEALISFDKATKLMTDPFDPHVNMAKLFSRMDMNQEALRHYQLALAIRPMSEIAKDGVQREHFLCMCLDQIAGWEQLGLDTSYLRLLLDEDPRNFVRKSKEFLASIVDQQTKVQVVPGKEHLDINNVMKIIMALTEPPGASLEIIKEETQMREKDLVLPLALLMETERVHFKMVDGKQLYVSKGRAPQRPPPVAAPPPPPPASRAPEPAPAPFPPPRAPMPRVTVPPPKPRIVEPKRVEPSRPIILAMPPPMLPAAGSWTEPTPPRNPEWVAPTPPPPVKKPIEVGPSQMRAEKTFVMTNAEPIEPEDIPDLKPVDTTPPEPVEMKRSRKIPPKPVKIKEEPKPKAKPAPPPAKKPEKKPEVKVEKPERKGILLRKKPERQEPPEKEPSKKMPLKKGLLKVPLTKKALPDEARPKKESLKKVFSRKKPTQEEPPKKEPPVKELPRKEPSKKELPKKEAPKKEAPRKGPPEKPGKEMEKEKAKEKPKEEPAPIQREVVRVEPTASLLVFRKRK